MRLAWAHRVLAVVILSQVLAAGTVAASPASPHAWSVPVATSTPVDNGRFPPPPDAPSTTTDVRTVDHAAAFVTPSGRIACLLTVDLARCDYVGKDREWTTLEPYFCDVAWGWSLFVTRLGSSTCVVDNFLTSTQLGSGFDSWHTATDPTATWNGLTLAALPAGSALVVGSFQCDSTALGVRCVNTTTQHGFSMTRAAYAIF